MTEKPNAADVFDPVPVRVKYYNKAGYVIQEKDYTNNKFRKFYLRRDVDITGNSGTGIVCEGVQFSDGSCVIHWDKTTNALEISSSVIYSCIADVEKVHGHNGSTVVVWED